MKTCTKLCSGVIYVYHDQVFFAEVAYSSCSCPCTLFGKGFRLLPRVEAICFCWCYRPATWSIRICMKCLLLAPTLQNGQTHSNNLSAVADELLSVFDHFVGLMFKGLSVFYKWSLYYLGLNCCDLVTGKSKIYICIFSSKGRI